MSAKRGKRSALKTEEARGGVWAEKWMESVVSGEVSMSQRAVSSIERNASMAEVKRAAKRAGVHLLLVKDEKGKEVVAASREEFRVIC